MTVDHRALSWCLRSRVLSFGKGPLLMGIVNVTPDSFSDGGKFHSHQAAVARALTLLDDGADIVDIGGESTRPFAAPVAAGEEAARVLPVIAEIHRLRPEAVLSIDTSKAEIAREAIAAGAEIVNDVTALGGDPHMIEVVRAGGAGVCVMHMRGTPQTMQDDPRYDDVVAEVRNFLQDRAAQLIAAGVEQSRIAIDPGIGFGKTHQHNLNLMASCDQLHALGYPIVVGHSRKAFIGKLIGDKSADRTAGTIGGALALARQGVQIVRVHEVRATAEALRLFEACGGIDGTPGVLP